MFNFFDELKGEFALNDDAFSQFNIINISARFLYIEGHKGLLTLGQEQVIVKVKKGRVVVNGQNLSLAKLCHNTIAVKGKIATVETICD